MTVKVNSPVTEADAKEQKLFAEAVKAANKQAKVMGCAVSGYDARRKKAYIDYPDKGRVYID